MSNKIRPEEISSILEQELAGFSTASELEEIGIVLQVGDGVVSIYGLSKVQAGELISFKNGLKALVLNLEEETVRAIVLGASHTIKEGDKVKRTRRTGSVQVSENLIGRVINTLGEPIDGKGPIKGPFFEMPLERKAPGVIYRKTVDQPLQTGITTIDSMISIGRGQRELIIGDRKTGKTTIAIDTIINQRHLFELGKPVYCIYVAIGQKASTVANVVAVLKKYGAMDYTTVVVASASTTASLQFLAPFTGTAIGEFFRDTGRHALVVYDDLSKQATAYREVSLLLRRSPGREAYPGDIFYLHARILERAAKINETDTIALQANDLPPSLKGKIKGGGSLTALPIIETQEGDVAAYIPTNVISITDGQIFLDANLFNAGIRPAINVGISVSRVGGSAQIKPMQKTAGTLKLDQAHFLELEAFTKFGSELDSATQKIIKQGRKTQKILKQPPYRPLSVALQVAIIYASTQGLLDYVPLDKIQDFKQRYLTVLTREHSQVLDKIAAGNFDDTAKEVFYKQAIEITRTYNHNKFD